jgi:chlorite dismutase
MTVPIPVSFAAGAAGEWTISTMTAVRGDGLDGATRLARIEPPRPSDLSAVAWNLRGVAGHERYVERAERAALAASPPLRRTAATCAALIPIRKSEAWWDLPQDERHAILGARSRHIAIGTTYLPAIARRLYHARDLGEPFDFLTWFEYAPEHAGAFDELVARLRASAEWAYVEREVDIRLAR